MNPWICLLVLAIGAGGGWGARAVLAERDMNRVVAQHAQAAQAAEAAAREQEQQFATNTRKAADAYSRNLSRTRNSAAAAAAGAAGVRDAIAGLPSQTCPEAGPALRVDATGALGDVLRECVATVQSLAAEADRLEGKLRGLQDYVRAVTP